MAIYYEFYVLCHKHFIILKKKYLIIIMMLPLGGPSPSLLKIGYHYRTTLHLRRRSWLHDIHHLCFNFPNYYVNTPFLYVCNKKIQHIVSISSQKQGLQLDEGSYARLFKLHNKGILGFSVIKNFMTYTQFKALKEIIYQQLGVSKTEPKP